ncbi:hypothetical protein DFH05DRAFT_1459587 [Lentinula detonsa]|uniref:Uncharacterized protein n=1 Tax=Lentinula detonsa TaxID=2804962 RepID=A0A9W8P2W3_9AGAR|nr:hypothetical protein DFH05DRAFT_1459587 [Lentinula detonsa]
MYLRAHTFFSALFVSLLFVASTFAIPITISPDSNSHDFLSDAQSPKLVDRDVVPKSIHARAKVPNRLPGSLVFPTKAIEAQVIFLGQQLSEEELTALKSAIETMLKPAMKFFNGVLKIGINEANEYEKVRYLLKTPEMPVTSFDYGPTSKMDNGASSGDTEYRFDFKIATRVPNSWRHYSTAGHPFHGTIARASLSSGGKLTGSIPGDTTK